MGKLWWDVYWLHAVEILPCYKGSVLYTPLYVCPLHVHTGQGHPGYFREPHRIFMGLPEISRVTTGIFVNIYNSSYYRHQIGSIYFSHCCHIFHGCVPEVVVPSYVGSFLYKYPGKAGLPIFYYCAVLWFAQIIKYIITWWPHSFVCTSHYLLWPIWRCWTSKMLVRYILYRVCLYD